MPTILLKNGTVLAHDATDTHVTALRATDLLIQDGVITQIGTSIDADAATARHPDLIHVDCTGKIVCPGFTNTHQHLWQTQLRGRHADETLLDYFTSGNVQSNNYSADDLFWGQLGGALEAVDAGTTFVLDHAHCCFDEHTASQALAATVTSGLRCLFAYMKPLLRVEKWDQESIVLAGAGEYPPDLGLDLLEDLAAKQPYGDGRVTMGFSFDQFWLPEDVVKQTFTRVVKAGAQGVTCHVVGAPFWSAGGTSAPQALSNYDLLTTTPNLVLSHCTNLSPEDYKLLSQTKTAISSTPETEAQMAHGYPLAFEPGLNVSLGVDCHTNNSLFMPQIARTGLFCARMRSNAEVLSRGQFPLNLRGNTEAAFNAMTIDGARAVGLQHQIGSLRVGKRADIVVFDTTRSTNMSCVAETDPLVAVVRHSDIRDVEMVIVDGIVRKKDGKLCPVVKTGIDGTTAGELTWDDVRKQLIRSTKEVWDRDAKCSHEKGREMHIKAFGTDVQKLVRVD